MDSAARPGEKALPETNTERQRRIAWEAARTAGARRELDSGLVVDAAEIDAWIDSIGTDHELPAPRNRR